MEQPSRRRPFGRAIRDAWPLEPEIVYLNHGTVGVVPLEVMRAQETLRREIESQPSRFLLRELTPMLGGDGPGRLRLAAEQVAAFLGARGDDLVFVDNATTGINAVLGSTDLRPGDAVLATETTYGGIRQALRHFCRRAGAEMVTARLPFPLEDPSEVCDAVEEALTSARAVRLAVLDHIVSRIGVVLPVGDLVALCHARGVRVLVDGAHAPGQLPLDIPSLGADYYVGNLHKWAMAPRGTGILWAHPDVQADLHPPVISWRLDRGFVPEFDWTGTRDPSAWLAAPAGLSFLARLGFEELRRYNHELLWRGIERLSRRWGTQPVAPETMSAFMTAIPLPEHLAAGESAALALRDGLLFEYEIEVDVSSWADRLWARLSAQVYNELSDFGRLADAVEALSRRPGRPWS